MQRIGNNIGREEEKRRRAFESNAINSPEWEQALKFKQLDLALTWKLPNY
jgi:hypothetical protein